MQWLFKYDKPPELLHRSLFRFCYDLSRFYNVKKYISFTFNLYFRILKVGWNVERKRNGYTLVKEIVVENTE